MHKQIYCGHTNTVEVWNLLILECFNRLNLGSFFNVAMKVQCTLHIVAKRTKKFYYYQLRSHVTYKKYVSKSVLFVNAQSELAI